MKLLCSISLLLLFYSCNTKQYKVDGPYMVDTDPGYGYMALYYDLGDGNAIERVPNIKCAGHTENFIIAENQAGFYIINSKKDNGRLNGSEIIGEPKSH